MKSLFSFFLSLSLGSSLLAGNLMDVVVAHSEDDDAYADHIATVFLQINTTYAICSGRGDPKTWDWLKPAFLTVCDKELFRTLDAYMNLLRKTPSPEDDWWYQRGFLFLAGNCPWECRLKRVRTEKTKILYRVDTVAHTSKESFGNNDPVFFTVSINPNGSAWVSDILFSFDPAAKGSNLSEEPVSIGRFVEYAKQKIPSKD